MAAGSVEGQARRQEQAYRRHAAGPETVTSANRKGPEEPRLTESVCEAAGTGAQVKATGAEPCCPLTVTVEPHGMVLALATSSPI